MKLNFHYSFKAFLAIVNVFSQSQDNIHIQGVFKDLNVWIAPTYANDLTKTWLVIASQIEI